ncbi:MAG: hypothetical protein AAFP15_08550 [Bacteroidota bacterium]
MSYQDDLQRRLRESEERLRKAKNGTAPTTAGDPDTVSARRVSGAMPDHYDLDHDDQSAIGAFAHGAGDTITFGFLDEIGAWIDTTLPEWAGGRPGTYEEALRRNRMILGRYEDTNPNTFFAGQIAGGFVPVAGWGGRARSAVTAVRSGRAVNVARATAEGAAMGALYGYGSGESESLFTTERLMNAGQDAVFGAAGGFILSTAFVTGARLLEGGFSKAMHIRTGKPVKLDFEFQPIGSQSLSRGADLEDLASLRRQEAPGPGAARDAASGVPKRALNRITGKTSDHLEDGALASANDLLDGAKREALLEKVTALSPQQAKVLAQRITEARGTGDLTKDPHFRSVLGMELEEFGDLEDVIPEVSNMLHELSEDILDKADLGRTSVESMEKELRKQYGGRIDEETLDALLVNARDSRNDATVGKIQSILAGIQFARVSQDLLPKVLEGDQAARGLLADELSTALRISAKGQQLMGEAGRKLGMLRHSKSLLFRQVDDGSVAVSKDEIAQRVRESMAKLDDESLNELLMSARDLSNLEEVEQVLMDAARAEQVNTWIRFRNTSEAFMKSTVMTPLTAAVNFVGVPIHSFMRHSGARMIAEASLRAQGRTREATIVAMQRQASSAVRWNAHMQGAAAAWRRVRWEALGSLKSIAEVAGSARVAARAGASRQALIARGYKPPPIREFNLKKRLAVTDTRAFNQKLAERAKSGMPFVSFVNALERSGAVALNTFDALGSASAKLASGVLDDYGRAMVMTREVYAEMAGKATAQALDEGVPADKLADYVQKQAQEWSTIPPREILERVEQKMISGEDLDEVDQLLLRRDFEAEREAERVLFLDGPQTSPGRVVAGAARLADNVMGLGIVKGALLPYISTPTRIMERGLSSYTPWGGFSDEVRKALNSTDPIVAATERARMDLGGTLLGAGMIAAATGVVSVTNGSYRNTEGLGQVPAMRLNLPDGSYVELGRLDPIALSVSMGAIIGQMWGASQETGDRYGQDDAIAEAMAVAYSGFRDALLEKSYLTGLSELVEAVSSQEEGALVRYYEKYIPDTAGRMIPFSGTIRQANETVNGKSLEAVGWLDRIAKVTPGMGAYLPARVDALGNEIDGRVMGLAVGTTADDDDVTAKMRELGIDVSNLRRADPAGFDLTSEELSDLRTIRANEALNSDGLTMKEALRDLFRDPAFQSLPDKSMVQDEVVNVMRAFNQPARELYEMRNQRYLADREAARSFKEYMQDGLSKSMSREAARETVEALGLEPSRTDALQ